MCDVRAMCVCVLCNVQRAMYGVISDPFTAEIHTTRIRRAGKLEQEKETCSEEAEIHKHIVRVKEAEATIEKQGCSKARL
jgi:hypothetical protein